MREVLIMTKTSNLTPLLQLNIFIHMGMNYPEGGLFKPYLRSKGYRIKTIGQNISVKQDIYKKIAKSLGKKVNQNVVPEIIFIHDQSNELLLLECKVISFPPDLDQRSAQQALGYLSLSPEYVSEYLGLPKKNNLAGRLIYSVDENYSIHLNQTLNDLSSIVSEILGDSMDYEIMGMESASDGIFLYVGNNSKRQKIKITEAVTKNQGTVIYLIPLDPEVDLADKYGMDVLEQQVKNSLRIIIGRLIGIREISFSVVDVCKDVIPVWDLWTSKSTKKIRRLVKIHIDKIKSDLEKRGVKLLYDNGLYTVPKVDQKSVEKVRGYFKSAVYEVGFNTISEQMNFDDFITDNDDED